MDESAEFHQQRRKRRVGSRVQGDPLSAISDVPHSPRKRRKTPTISESKASVSVNIEDRIHLEQNLPVGGQDGKKPMSIMSMLNSPDVNTSQSVKPAVEEPPKQVPEPKPEANVAEEPVQVPKQRGGRRGGRRRGGRRPKTETVDEPKQPAKPVIEEVPSWVDLRARYDDLMGLLSTYLSWLDRYGDPANTASSAISVSVPTSATQSRAITPLSSPAPASNGNDPSSFNDGEDAVHEHIQQLTNSAGYYSAYLSRTDLLGKMRVWFDQYASKLTQEPAAVEEPIPIPEQPAVTEEP